MARKQTHRQIFLAANPSPWNCFVCGDEITISHGRDTEALNVHHKDEDKSNNALTNLYPTHQGCHTIHHHLGKPNTGYPKGRPMSSETRTKMRESQKKRHAAAGGHSAETRAKIGAANAKALKGRKHSPEHVAAITEGMKRAAAEGRWVSPALRPDVRKKIAEAVRARPELTCEICDRVIKGGHGNLDRHQASSKCLPIRPPK